MESGLNIYASVTESGSPFDSGKQISYISLTVKVKNDGNSEIQTDVVCERTGTKEIDKTTVKIPPYSIREVYFTFNPDRFHDEVRCRLENVEFTGFYPLL